jgi:hypothetical protein
MPQWQKPRWPNVRDPLIVLTGLALSVYEAAFASTFHPELLIFCTSLIAAPAFIRKDDKRNEARDSGESPSGSSPL